MEKARKHARENINHARKQENARKIKKAYY